MLYNLAVSQTHSGIEQYYYTGNKSASAIVPKAYYQDKKNWYGEIRYNYEEPGTFSFNAGKTFSKQTNLSYTITPIAGVVVGRLNGASIGVNLQSDYKKISFSAESQYTFSANNRNADFFYNWSELSYQVTQNIFAGFVLQLTRPYETINKWEPGIMAGFSFDKWTFPLYVFNPGNRNRYFVLGINIEWSGIKKNSPKNEIPLLTETEEGDLQ